MIERDQAHEQFQLHKNDDLPSIASSPENADDCSSTLDQELRAVNKELRLRITTNFGRMQSLLVDYLLVES